MIIPIFQLFLQFSLIFGSATRVLYCGQESSEKSGILTDNTNLQGFVDADGCKFEIILGAEMEFGPEFVRLDFENIQIPQGCKIKISSPTSEIAVLESNNTRKELFSGSHTVVRIIQELRLGVYPNFRIPYTSVSKYEVCGGWNESLPTWWATPNYPFRCPAGVSCLWWDALDEAESAFGIRTENFNLNPCSHTGIGFKIETGPSTTRLCGKREKPFMQLFSSGRRYLETTFDSSSAGSPLYSGMNITFFKYRPGDACTAPPNYVHLSRTQIGITSMYPMDQLGTAEYCKNINFTWILIAPVGFQVRLKFEQITLDPYEEISVYDGRVKSGTPLVRYLDNNTNCDEIIGSGPGLRIEWVGARANLPAESLFRSHAHVTYSPNSNKFCGVQSITLRYNQGKTIRIHLDYWFPFLVSKNCTYQITVPTNGGLKIQGRNRDWLPLSVCSIRNGSVNDSQEILHKCPVKNEWTLIESSQVILRVDSDTEIKPFFMEAVHLEKNLKVDIEDNANYIISNPEYPNGYFHKFERVWHLSAGSGRQITCKFLVFETYGGAFLQIFAGSSENRRKFEISRFSGSKTTYPEEFFPVTSGNNHLTIKFDNSQPLYSSSTGKFQLKCSTINDQTYRTSWVDATHPGVIVSSKLPNSFPFGVTKRWNVSVPEGRIVVTFRYLYLSSFHHLQFFDDNDDNERNLLKDIRGGKRNVHSVQSCGNRLVIVLKPNWFSPSTVWDGSYGFILDYRAKDLVFTNEVCREMHAARKKSSKGWWLQNWTTFLAILGSALFLVFFILAMALWCRRDRHQSPATQQRRRRRVTRVQGFMSASGREPLAASFPEGEGESAVPPPVEALPSYDHVMSNEGQFPKYDPQGSVPMQFLRGLTQTQSSTSGIFLERRNRGQPQGSVESLETSDSSVEDETPTDQGEEAAGDGTQAEESSDAVADTQELLTDEAAG